MADDIKLKVGMDASDIAKQSGEIDKALATAFGSSDKNVQKLGNALKSVKAELQAAQAEVKTLQSTTSLSAPYLKLNQDIADTKKSLDEVEAKMKKLEDTGDDLEYSDNYKKALADQKKLLEELEPLQMKYNYLKTKYDKGFGSVTAADVKKAEDAMNVYKTKLTEVQTKMETMKSKGLGEGGKWKYTQDFKDAKDEAEKLKLKLADLQAEKKKLIASGGAGVDNSAKIAALNSKIASLSSTAGGLVSAINSSATGTKKLGVNWVNVGNTAKQKITTLASAIKDKLGNAIKSTGKTHNSTLSNMISKVAKLGLYFFSLTTIFNNLKTIIKTGMTEMAKQFSSVAGEVNSLKNSWSGFKSSIVSAFQPIYSYILPALTTLINYLTSAMNSLANFFAMITGKSTYYKAVKGNEDVAESVSGTGSAAADANEELAEYDELIVVESDSSSSGSGGGSGSGSDAWNWEETEVNADDISDKLLNVWKKFKNSWEENGQTTINNAKNALNSLKTLISTVLNTIYEVFMSDTGTAWLDSNYNLLNSFLDLIASIASAWTKAWNDNKTGYNLVNSVFTLLTTINNMLSTIMTTWAKVFNSETGYKTLESFLTLAKNIIDTINSIATAFTNAWKKDNTGYKNVESFFNLFKDISDLLSTITTSFKKAWESDGTGETTIKNILDFITNINNTLGNIATNFKTAWENAGTGDTILETILGMVESISSFLESISSSTKTWSENLNFSPVLESISSLLSSASGFLDTILSKVSDIYNNFILPMGKKFTESYLPTLLDIVSDGLSGISGLLEGLPIDDISTALSEIVDLVATLGLNALKSDISELSTLFSTTGTYIDTLYKSFTDLWGVVSNLIGIETTSWEDFKEVLNLTNTAAVPLATAFDLLNANIQLNINAITTIKEKLDELKDWIDTNKDTITQLGSNLSGGIVGGIAGYDWIKNLTDTMFSPFVKTIKTLFDIASPAKKMYVYGEYILDGIIQGIKNAFDNIKDVVKSLYDKFTSNITDKFKNFKISDFLTGLGDVAVNITTSFKGAITALTDWTNFDDTLDTIKTSYKDMKAKLKTTLEGEIQKLADLTDLDDKWKKLKDDWADKEAKLKAYVGGQLTKVTDIDSWKDKFGLLKENWTDAKATLSAYVGGAISDVQELTGADGKSGWYGIITKLKGAWTGSDATFTTKADTHETDEAISDGGSFKKATDIWQNQTATFSATTDTPEELEEKVKKLAETWSKYDAEATFTVNTPDDAIQNAKNTIADLYNCWTSYDGTQASFNVAVNGSSNLSTAFAKLVADINSAIKQAGGTTSIDSSKYTKYFLARGGIVSGATNFVAGEDGAEAVIPLERNLGWMDKMATSISDKLATVALPAIVQGSVLPTTESFISKNSVTDKNDQVVSLLQQLIEVMTTNEDSNNAPIMLQLDGRTIAQAVWDENNKKYKQTGVRYAI